MPLRDWDLSADQIKKLTDEELAELKRKAQAENVETKYGTFTPAKETQKKAIARFDREIRQRQAKRTFGPVARAARDAKMGSEGRVKGTVGGAPSGFRTPRNPDGTLKEGYVENPLSRDQLKNRGDFGGGFQMITDQGDINPEVRTAVLGNYTATGRVTGNPGGGGSVLRSGARGNLRMLQGMTVEEALNFVRSLSSDELHKIQFDLMDAGMYGFQGESAPNWGVLSDADYAAFERFVGKVIQNKDRTVAETLSGLQTEAALTRKRMGQSEADAAAEKIASQKQLIEVPSTEMLSQAVDQVAQQLLGSNLDEATKQGIIAGIQARSRSHQEQEIDITAENAMNRATAGTAEGNTDLDAFMSALIGQESGGDPNVVNSDSGAWGIGQIMPNNWVPWATEAGANPNDRSEANQRKVIKYKLNQYYQTYGNWHDVAVAWYAGGGAVGASWLDRPQGAYPSVNDYADQVLGRMGEFKGGGAAASYRPQTVVREGFDMESQLNAAVRAANPVAYEGTKYADKWDSFVRLMGGVRSAMG